MSTTIRGYACANAVQANEFTDALTYALTFTDPKRRKAPDPHGRGGVQFDGRGADRMYIVGSSSFGVAAAPVTASFGAIHHPRESFTISEVDARALVKKFSSVGKRVLHKSTVLIVEPAQDGSVTFVLVGSRNMHDQYATEVPASVPLAKRSDAYDWRSHFPGSGKSDVEAALHVRPFHVNALIHASIAAAQALRKSETFLVFPTPDSEPTHRLFSFRHGDRIGYFQAAAARRFDSAAPPSAPLVAEQNLTDVSEAS